jgi:hypothetical protein
VLICRRAQGCPTGAVLLLPVSWPGSAICVYASPSTQSICLYIRLSLFLSTSPHQRARSHARRVGVYTSVDRRAVTLLVSMKSLSGRLSRNRSRLDRARATRASASLVVPLPPSTLHMRDTRHRAVNFTSPIKKPEASTFSAQSVSVAPRNRAVPRSTFPRMPLK